MKGSVFADPFDREETEVIIQIDTTQPLSPLDRQVLDLVLDKETTAPAKKAAAKKAAAPATAPEPEREVVTEVVKGEVVEEADTELRDAAVSRAADLLSSGQRDRVMAALKKAGNAPRVSEISAEYIPGFLNALTDD